MDFFNRGDDQYVWIHRTRAFMERANPALCPVCNKKPSMLAQLKFQPGTGLIWWSYQMYCGSCKLSGMHRDDMPVALRMWNNMAKRVRAKIEEGRG